MCFGNMSKDNGNLIVDKRNCTGSIQTQEGNRTWGVRSGWFKGLSGLSNSKLET